MAIENGKSDTKGIIPAHYSDDGNQYVELADSDGDKLEIVNGAVKVSQGALDKDVDDITTYEALQNGGSSARVPVPTPGTKVAVASTSTPCVGVSFQAYETNTDRVTIGFSDVVGALATQKGIRSLEAGDYHYQPISDANLLYLDSVVANEGCVVTIHTRV